MLCDAGIASSMSGRGNCFANAMVETVFKTLKAELSGELSSCHASTPNWRLAAISTASTINPRSQAASTGR
jgi:transposase InsO family protein